MTQKRRLRGRWPFVCANTVIPLTQQAEAATYRQAPAVSSVTIQTKLENWGYYDAR